MGKKIKALTPEQEAMMPIWRDKWIAIGLRTGDADWDTFDKYMPICYKKAGLKYPSRVVRVPSPFSGAHVASVAHEIWNKRYADSGARDNRLVRYWLFEFPADPDMFPQGAMYAVYDDSMLGAAEQHAHGVPKECKTVPEAMGWKQDITPELWESLILDADFT